MTEWRFDHYSGTGNTFLITYDPSNLFPGADKEYIALLCQQEDLVVDGLLIATPSCTANIRMLYYNRDGSRAKMCGNGLRCLAHYTYMHLFPNRSYLTIETDCGIRRAYIENELVEVEMGPIEEPTPWTISIEKISVSGFFLDTGVPHAIIPVENLKTIDLPFLGKEIRFHPFFQPDGTNVTFITSGTTTDLAIRTYERGVEAETEACGTGAVAAAKTIWHTKAESTELTIQCQSQEILTIRKELVEGKNWYFLRGNVHCCGIFDETIYPRMPSR